MNFRFENSVPRRHFTALFSVEIDQEFPESCQHRPAPTQRGSSILQFALQITENALYSLVASSLEGRKARGFPPVPSFTAGVQPGRRVAGVALCAGEGNSLRSLPKTRPDEDAAEE